MSAIITTHTTAPIGTIVANDYFLIASHGSIITSGVNAINVSGAATNVRIDVLGSVASSAHAIVVAGRDASGNNNSTVEIAPGGTVVSASNTYGAIYALGDGFALRNDGFIGGRFGVFVGGNGFDLINSGTVSGNDYAFDLRLTSNTNWGTLQNSGTVNGTINIDTGTVILENSGTIQAKIVAIDYDASGTAGLNIVNSGIIKSGLYAIAIPTDDTTPATLINTGTTIGSVVFSAVNDRVQNSGTMVGATLLNGGADTFNNSGDVQGSIILGGGNDTYAGPGTVSGTVYGGAGDDTFRTRGEGNSFSGDTGSDTLLSWADVESAKGIEKVRLRGKADLDATLDDIATTLLGNSGDNELFAGGGRDTIFGGRGADIIVGGQGRDTMTGGPGRDTFVFSDKSHSGIAVAGRDRIQDFTRRQDKIDLTSLSPDKFDWRGTALFTASGDPEVRYTDAGADVIVRIDIDGNGTLDSTILVRDVAALSAGDFLL